MEEVGAFTPEQARLIWQDYQTRQQLNPKISQNFPQRRMLDEPSPHRVFVKNDSGEEIPSFGCMEIAGTEEVGERTVVTVTKPTGTDGEYLFNSQFPIAIGENGWAYRFGVVIMLGTPPADIAQYRPIASSWNIEEGSGPFVVFGEHTVVSGALIGRFAAGSASGDYIAFTFVDSSSSSSSGSSSGDLVPDDCASRIPSAGPYTGQVTYKSCGMVAVPGESIDGTVELADLIGIMDDRDYRDIIGRTGFAVRMSSEGVASTSVSGSSSQNADCIWMILYVDFWRVVSVVTDIIFGEESITIKRRNLTVWDDCGLPDEVIIGTDCATTSSSSSSSGSV